jgi:hypothetical protein
LNQTEEVFNLTLITNQNTSVALQPSVQPFDLPTPLVSPQLTPILCLGLYSVSSVRGNQFNAFNPNFGIQWITVVSTISNQSLWLGCDKSRCDSRFHKGDFMRRSTFQVNGDRKTRAVCHCHDLRTFAPLGLSHCPPPFLADTKVPSMKHSDKSSLPRSFKSSASLVRIFSNTPARCHSWKRRWQVAGEGYRSGRSCQAAPVRSTHRIPFNTSRLLIRGRPFPSSRCALIGTNGSSIAHCSSVSSISHAHSLSLTYFTHF